MWILIVIMILIVALDWVFYSLAGLGATVSVALSVLVALALPASFIWYHTRTRRGRAAADRACEEQKENLRIRRQYDRMWKELHKEEADLMSDRDVEIYCTLLECEKQSIGISGPTVYILPNGQVYNPPDDYFGPFP